MKAIITKILPVTNTKPTRIKAQAEGVPALTFSRGALEDKLLQYGARITEENLHGLAARQLCNRYDWNTKLVSGGLPKSGEWAHCFLNADLH